MSNFLKPDGTIDTLGVERQEPPCRELVARKGGQVVKVFILSTSAGRMMFRIAGALARRESEHRAERLMIWNDQRAEHGKPHAGGTRPFGFARNGLDHEPAEADLIREAAERVLGGESMGAIVHDWHDRKIQTPTGKPFHTTTLRRVLTNPRIAGLRVHRGEVIGEATWNPIVSRGDFERLRALFAGRPRQRIGRPHTYPYSGLLRCGRKDCGGRMTGSSRGAAQKAYGCERCDRTWITAAPVEAFLDEAVIATLAGEGFAASLAEQMRAWAAEDPATAAQLEADKRELAELAR